MMASGRRAAPHFSRGCCSSVTRCFLLARSPFPPAWNPPFREVSSPTRQRFERSRVSGNNRVPCPPPMIMERTLPIFTEVSFAPAILSPSKAPFGAAPCRCVRTQRLANGRFLIRAARHKPQAPSSRAPAKLHPRFGDPRKTPQIRTTDQFR